MRLFKFVSLLIAVCFIISCGTADNENGDTANTDQNSSADQTGDSKDKADESTSDDKKDSDDKGVCDAKTVVSAEDLKNKKIKDLTGEQHCALQEQGKKAFSKAKEFACLTVAVTESFSSMDPTAGPGNTDPQEIDKKAKSECKKCLTDPKKLDAFFAQMDSEKCDPAAELEKAKNCSIDAAEYFKLQEDQIAAFSKVTCDGGLNGLMSAGQKFEAQNKKFEADCPDWLKSEDGGMGGPGGAGGPIGPPPTP